MLKRIALLLFACCSTAAMSCQIAINNVRTCDSHGNPGPWSYSSPYYGIRVDWTVTGAPAAPYAIKFGLADSLSITFTGYHGAGTYWSYCQIGYPSLFALPATVTIDSTHVSGNTTPSTAVQTRIFTPTLPATAVAYYGARTLYGKQSMTVPVNSGIVSKLVMMLGKPVTGTFQSVQSDASLGTSVISQPTGYPVYEKILKNAGKGSYTLSQTFSITASNVACNVGLIHATWPQIDALKSSMKNYLGAEQFAETGDSKIVAFTKASLPANYRTSLSPLQTAEKLFQAVVRAVTYQTPYTVDASTVFHDRTGDCGGMTNLYNACLRLVGIPARIVDGWWMDQTPHCWSEIYFPVVGWVPADASLSRKQSITCAYLPFFGFSPGSNQRCAVCRTGSIVTPDMSSGFLQVGAWVYYYTTPTPPSAGPMTYTKSLGISPPP